MLADMDKRKILFVLTLLVFTACADMTNRQANLKGEGESINTAPPRPYSDLVPYIPVEKLSERADYVLHGDVNEVSGTVEKIAPNISMPVSSVTLNVREVLKGNANGTFTFKSLGAEIDGLPYFSGDMARFTVGETVVVFLKDFDGTILPVGHAQGKVVIRDEDDVDEIKDKIIYEK